MNRTEHLLVILAEECSEIIKDVSKALRFGVNDGEPGQDLTNGEKITKEIGDLYGVIQMLCKIDVIEPPFNDDIEKKKIKVEKFLEYSKKVGTLTE